LMNQFIYTVGSGFSGSASIDFSVNDQQGGIDSKSLAILVNANSAPVIANVTSNLIYVENQGFSPLFASATLSDANHANLTIARVTIVSGFTSASDVFVFNPFPQVIETAGVPGGKDFQWCRFDSAISKLAAGHFLLQRFRQSYEHGRRFKS
jgi:hypothetical protein